MRLRAQTASGDMTFGQSQRDFLVNTPAAVAQLTVTRLELNVGDWFLDITDGIAWNPQVVGRNTAATRDIAIKSRILSTQGVLAILSYSGVATGRNYVVAANIDTTYGQALVSATL